MVNSRGQTLHGARAVPDQVRGHVLLAPGLGEFSQKYIELARDFNRHALAFHVFDRQGQGLSGRNAPDPLKIHCHDYRDDVEDIEQYAMTKIPRDGKPLILVGHSTGGLLCVPVLHKDCQRKASERLFSGALLTDPLCGFQEKAIRGREKIMASLPILSRAMRQAFVPGAMREWMRRDDPRAPLKPADYSTDPARAQVHDYWTTRHPDLRVTAATLGWVQQMCRAMMTIRQHDYIESITTPISICTADMKLHVDQASIMAATHRFPQARLMEFPDARHELLMERDDVRAPIINEVARLARKP